MQAQAVFFVQPSSGVENCLVPSRHKDRETGRIIGPIKTGRRPVLASCCRALAVRVPLAADHERVRVVTGIGTRGEPLRVPDDFPTCLPCVPYSSIGVAFAFGRCKTGRHNNSLSQRP